MFQLYTMEIGTKNKSITITCKRSIGYTNPSALVHNAHYTVHVSRPMHPYLLSLHV